MVCRARSARPPRDFQLFRTSTSTGVSADFRTPPRISSFTRSARHALTRRCNVRNCAFLHRLPETLRPSRFINSLAGTEGSAISQPSITGHASANGSDPTSPPVLCLGLLSMRRTCFTLLPRRRKAGEEDGNVRFVRWRRFSTHAVGSESRSMSAEPFASPAAAAQDRGL